MLHDTASIWEDLNERMWLAAVRCKQMPRNAGRWPCLGPYAERAQPDRRAADELIMHISAACALSFYFTTKATGFWKTFLYRRAHCDIKNRGE